MLKGIDVSEHQGRINWNEVKSQVDFVMLRAGFGRNNIDKQFRRNIEECNRLQIPVGIYWFSYAYSEEMARQEARYALEAIKNYRLDYPISFDLEYDTIKFANRNGVNIGKSLATKMVRAFCLEIERNGYYAMNYTNRDFMRNKFNMSDINRFKIWYAWYNSKLDTKDHVGMWQYSEKGKVRGIDGCSVDMNYSLIDFAKVIREKGLNKSKNFKPYSPSKPNSSSSSSSGFKLVSQHGTCTVIVDKLNIREKPSTNSDKVGTYYKNQSVVYDYYVDNEGYRWISWIGGSGKRRYMAVRVLSSNKRYGHCV